ncbi:MAG TPA: site-specific integrase [Bryobacteraceae bacterium]|nr:site-specific integrase [Bryobacteraceae bacterium]
MASRRFWEFFTANIPKDNTRRAYYAAACQFSTWCARYGLEDLSKVQPVHVAAWVKESGTFRSRPTVKQHLAAIRMLLDWLVTGQVLPVNPANAVRGPKHTVNAARRPFWGAKRCVICSTAFQPVRARSARSRLTRVNGIHVRPHWRGPEPQSGRLLRAEAARLDSAARKRRQGE